MRKIRYQFKESDFCISRTRMNRKMQQENDCHHRWSSKRRRNLRVSKTHVGRDQLKWYKYRKNNTLLSPGVLFSLWPLLFPKDTSWQSILNRIRKKENWRWRSLISLKEDSQSSNERHSYHHLEWISLLKAPILQKQLTFPYHVN